MVLLCRVLRKSSHVYENQLIFYDSIVFQKHDFSVAALLYIKVATTIMFYTEHHYIITLFICDLDIISFPYCLFKQI